MNGKDIIRFGKKYSPLILSGIGIGSSVAATILAGKAERSLPKDPSRKERTKAYQWAILAETVAIVALSAGTAISWNRAKELSRIAQAASKNLAVVSASTAASIGANRVGMVRKTKENLSELPAQNNDSGVELWYDAQFDHFFEARETDILWSMYYSLGYFTEHGELQLKDFYHSIGAVSPKGTKGVGWYVDDNWLLEWEDYTLEFSYDHEPITDADGRTYRRLVYIKPPKFYEELYY